MKTMSKRKPRKTNRKTSAAHFVEMKAGRALRRGRATIARAYDWASEEGMKLRNLHLPSRRDLEALSEANPLLLGAVGLGLGVAIGTMFPHHSGQGRSTHRTSRPTASAAQRRPSRRRRRTTTMKAGKAKVTSGGSKPLRA